MHISVPRAISPLVVVAAAAALVAPSLTACGASGLPPVGTANSVSTVASGGTPQASVAPSLPTPETNPCYLPPSPLPNAPAGTILKSCVVTFAPLGGAPMTNKAWLLQFVSHDVNGQPIAAVATVVMPTTAATGGARLVAFQYAEDGLGNKCAPSHTVAGGTADSVSQAESGQPLPLLNQGYTLVYPDHEGPESAYAAGRLAGQITLDAIRAAERFAPLGLTSNTSVAMWGYSGGAIATAWAASLQKAYAPELQIIAVASGGTPADVIGIAMNADTNTVTNAGFFNLILSAIEGVNRSYPQTVTPILNAKGLAAFESLKDGCVGATSDGSATPTGHLADYTTTSDPFNSPGTLAVAPLITLPLAGNNPIVDTFVYHSQLDELIPIAGADAMVAAWCKGGSHVAYYRGASGDHVAFEATGGPLAIAYLESRLNSSPTTVVPPGSAVCN